MLVEELRSRTADRQKYTALVQGEKRVSYKAMWLQVENFAEILRARGLGKDDIVFLCVSNSIEATFLLLALWQIEAVPCLIAANHASLLDNLFKNSIIPKAAIIEISQSIDKNSRIRHLVSSFFTSSTVILDNHFTIYSSLFTYQEYDKRINRDSIIWITSSGSEGEAKLISLGVKGTLANIRSNVESLNLNPEDKTLMYLPLTYSYGLIGQLLSHFFVGGTIVFPINSTLVHAISSLIERENITTFFTVPNLLRLFLYTIEGSNNKKASFNHLRLLTIGGDSIDLTTLRKTLNLFEHTEVAITYGLAEAGPRVATYFVREQSEPQVFAGRALREVKIDIVDEQQRPLPLGTTGEIVVFSPSVMQGYVFHLQQHLFIPETMIYTNDLGYFTREGYLKVLGRKSEHVNVQEHLVSFSQIKDKLYQHPDILYTTVHLIENESNKPSLKISITPKPQRRITLASLSALLEDFAFLYEFLSFDFVSFSKLNNLHK